MRSFRIIVDERGASMVEFGLLAPAFFLLIMGIIECGLLLRAEHALQNAVEMAARCASVNTNLRGSTSEIQSYAARQAFGPDPPLSTFSVATAACGTRLSANYELQPIVLNSGAGRLLGVLRQAYRISGRKG